MLNMTDYVHPYHWDVEKFETFIGLEPDKEFDLIAPVAIYFQADVCYKEKARNAWAKLKKEKHPVAAEVAASEMLKERFAPDGIVERYNALFMYLCKQEWPDANFTQDKWGAFVVMQSYDRDADQFSGCSDGQFPWYESSNGLKDRLAMEVEN